MEETQLTEGQAQQLWNEEASKLDADANASALENFAIDPVEELHQDFIEEEIAAAPEPEADPLAGLSDVVRAKLAQIDQLAEANTLLQQHVKSAEGRVAAMQREFQAARQVAAQEAPSQGQIVTAAKNPEKWDALKEDFPEWAGAMEEYVASKLGGVQQQPGLDPEAVAAFVHQQVAQTKAEMGRLLEEARIEGNYEDWKDTVNTTEFAQWFSVQNPDVRALADSSAAKDAIRMLDMYSKTKERSASDIKQERGARLAVAATARPGQTRPPKTLDDMSPDELWNYEAAKREKTKAQRGF